MMVDLRESTGAIAGVSKWTSHSFYGMPFFLEKKKDQLQLFRLGYLLDIFSEMNAVSLLL